LFGFALGVLIVSGLIDGLRLVGSPSNLFSGWHGRLLVLKALVTAAIVVLWLGLRDVIDNGLRRLAYLGDRMRARSRGRLARGGCWAVRRPADRAPVGYRPAAAGKETSEQSSTGISVDLTGSRHRPRHARPRRRGYQPADGEDQRRHHRGHRFHASSRAVGMQVDTSPPTYPCQRVAPSYRSTSSTRRPDSGVSSWRRSVTPPAER
jgi:hypothetical protein